MNANKSELDVGKIFRLVLMQSKLIILFLIFVFFTGIGFYYFAEKRYSVSSLLQVYSNKANSFSPQSLDLFSGNILLHKGECLVSQTETTDLTSSDNSFRRGAVPLPRAIRIQTQRHRGLHR